MPELTSRERMLRVLRHEAPDYVPCCFMSFTALRRRCQENLYELVKAERAWAWTPFFLSLLCPVRSAWTIRTCAGCRCVSILRWDCANGGKRFRARYAILHKEYSTPAGKLETSVRLSDDWPHGNHIPFVDDYQVPRAIKPLLSGEASELETLRYLLTPPQSDDVEQFQVEAERAQAFAREQGVLLAGGWGVGVDMANWLCGFENLMVLEHEKPALFAELLEMIHRWNHQRMAVVLSGKSGPLHLPGVV